VRENQGGETVVRGERKEKRTKALEGQISFLIKHEGTSPV